MDCSKDINFMDFNVWKDLFLSSKGTSNRSYQKEREKAKEKERNSRKEKGFLNGKKKSGDGKQKIKKEKKRYFMELVIVD